MCPGKENILKGYISLEQQLGEVSIHLEYVCVCMYVWTYIDMGIWMYVMHVNRWTGVVRSMRSISSSYHIARKRGFSSHRWKSASER